MDLSKLSDADLRAIQSGDLRMMSVAGLKAIAGQKDEYNAIDGMSGTDKFIAGAGKAFADIGRGVGQMFDKVSQQEIDEAKRIDAPLMGTGAGLAGNMLGTVAGLAPTVMIPGANTVSGAALINGAAGLALTPGSLEERAKAGAWGAGGGALGVGLVKGAVGAKNILNALTSPFSEEGRRKIVGDVMRRAAGNNADDVVGRLKNAQELVTGSLPTAADVADSGGIAALQRAMSAASPEDYSYRGMMNNAARVQALRNIAGDSATRARQQKLVDETAKNLYGEAFKESIPVTNEMVRLASRPSMRMAESRATKLADELSIPFRATLEEMRPKYIPIGSKNFSSSVVDKVKNPDFDVYSRFHLPQTIDVEKTIHTGTSPVRYFEVPPVDSVPVRDLHTIKMGMDALLSDPTLGIAGREANAIAATRSKLLDSLPDSYQAARQAHIDLNKPIHQMDIASELLNKVEPALVNHHPSGAHFRQSAGTYANALRNGDDVAKKVTGLKNAKMADVMTPDQMQTLNNIAADLSRSAAAADLGRGAGSNTFQNFAMDNLASQMGMPSAVSAIANIIPGIGRVSSVGKALGNSLYKSRDELMKQEMAGLLLNPKESAKVMEDAIKPGFLADFITQKIGEDGIANLISRGYSTPGLLGSSFILTNRRE